MQKTYSSHLADKSEKKAIKAFYRKASYSASYMGLDKVWVIKTLETDEVIASVIVSQIKPNATQHLLHALVVSPNFRQQGLGKTLLAKVANYFAQEAHHQTNNPENPQLEIIVFADKSLVAYYQSHDYQLSEVDELNEELAGRYHSYQAKQPQLKILKFIP